MIPCQRELFEIPRELSYLNCAYFGPQLRSVSEVGRAALGRKATPWTTGPADFFEDPAQVRECFARLVDGGVDEVALLPSASYGLSLAAANTPVKAGQNLVVLAEQFPSNVYPWRERARECGASLRTVPRPADGDWSAGVLESIDADTAAVALPQFHWTDGSRVELEPIARRCRELGAVLALDLTQSLGAVPFSVRSIEADFVVAAAYKWLLGPYGMAFAWIHPRHHEGRPFEHNWITRRDPEDFAGLVDYRDEYQPGARRFDVGEHSNFVLMPMALRALRQILDWGVEDIAASVAQLSRQIAEGARALELVVVDDTRRGPHLLGLRSPTGLPDDLLPRLAADHVHVSRRGDSIRVAPHLYNDEVDVERLLSSLAKVLGR